MKASELLYASVGVLSIADLATVAYGRLLLSRNPSIAIHYRATRQTAAIPPPTIVDSGGALLNNGAKPSRGWLVRYAAKNCRFCKQDGPFWIDLSRRVHDEGGGVILLLPSTVDAYPPNAVPGDAVQAAFVDLEWLRHFRFLSTPTEILFSSEGRILWAHQGTLNAGDVSSALNTYRASIQGANK